MQHKVVVCAFALGAAIGLAGSTSAAPDSGARAAAPPRAGELVLGKSLGGVRLGMTKAQVLCLWGSRHGVCRDCPRTTWYFNYRAFEPQGAGVVFERGRAVHVFTIWKPAGWRTPEGLRLGAEVSEITLTYGPLTKRECSGYYALVAPARDAQSAFYVAGDELWGFGLTRPGSSPCL